jgi:hypothetical protein
MVNNKSSLTKSNLASIGRACQKWEHFAGPLSGVLKVNSLSGIQRQASRISPEASAEHQHRRKRLPCPHGRNLREQGLQG